MEISAALWALWLLKKDSVFYVKTRAYTFMISDEFSALCMCSPQLIELRLCAKQLFLDSRPRTDSIIVTSLQLT